MMYLKWVRFCLLFPCFILVSCSHDPVVSASYDSPSSNSEDTARVGLSLIRDKKFENGLLLKGNNTSHPSTGKALYPFGGEGKKPDWNLAEWDSKFLIHQSDLTEKNGAKVYENQGKLVSFKHVNTSTLVRMDVEASEEYDHPREAGESWVHLLLGQNFIVKPPVKDMDKFLLSFDGRLVNCELKMSPGTYDPGLHTAQFQLFLTIQNLNKQSSDYGDFLWFGVPFYDYRYKKISRFAAEDGGKADASQKFIFSLGTSDYTGETFHDKQWIKIKVDLKPFILDAVETAKKRGFLQGSQLSDLSVSGMNIGWEVPGIFDCAFEFKNFDLQYYTSK